MTTPSSSSPNVNTSCGWPSARPLQTWWFAGARTMTDARPFYDGPTPLYHLIYPDWNASIRQQAAMLDAVIREQWGDRVTTVSWERK